MGEAGVAQEEVGIADGGPELGELKHTVGLGAGEEVFGAVVKLDGEWLGGVAEFGGAEGEVFELGGGGGAAEVAFEEAAALFGFEFGEVGAVNGVVDALKVNGGVGGEGASLVEGCVGVEPGEVLVGGDDGGGAQGVAFGAGDDVAHVLEIGGEDVFGVFVGGVHEDIFALVVEGGGDGVVEEGLGDFFVFFGAGHDDDGEGIDAGDAEHGGEEGGFIPADAVAVFEGDGDIVGFVAGGFLFGGDAHVANLLRDEGEERFDFFLGAFAVGEVEGGLFEGGGGAFHSGEAEVPVPTGEFFPAGYGADE